jgi:hypothetical protein
MGRHSIGDEVGLYVQIRFYIVTKLS